MAGDAPYAVALSIYLSIYLSNVVSRNTFDIIRSSFRPGLCCSFVTYSLGIYSSFAPSQERKSRADDVKPIRDTTPVRLFCPVMASTKIKIVLAATALAIGIGTPVIVHRHYQERREVREDIKANERERIEGAQQVLMKIVVLAGNGQQGQTLEQAGIQDESLKSSTAAH
jgi:hypothetical protein